jgi:4-hydroxybenzoate polyprenyltransferase
MTILILLFLLAFAGGFATQEARHAKSRTSRVVSGFLAIAFALIYFGYAIGKDMALRDNDAKLASVSSPVSP